MEIAGKKLIVQLEKNENNYKHFASGNARSIGIPHQKLSESNMLKCHLFSIRISLRSTE